jgi:hypothetical protein
MPRKTTKSILTTGRSELRTGLERVLQFLDEAAPPPENRRIPSRRHRWIPPTAKGRHVLDQQPSPGLRIQQREQRAVALAASDELVLVKNTLLGAADNNAASDVGEPSVASNGDLVFYTGNWYAAISFDGGDSFRFVDPFHTFPDPDHMAFCCDQIVNYVPSIDTFFWSLQYTNTQTDGGANIQRLAFARTADARAGRWQTFDITPDMLGRPGAFLDFPDLVFGANFLYLTTNVFQADRWTDSAIVRIPLTEFASGQVTAEHALSSDNFAFRVASYCGSKAFWASHQDTSTLRVFEWDEESPNPTFTDVPVATYEPGPFNSLTPAGLNWLGRLDDRLVGATMAAKELWFAWSANKGGVNNRPNPYAQIARIDSGTLQLLENINLWDPQFAIAYPALASNVNNDVGVSYMFGGENQHPSHAVGFLTGRAQHVTTVTGDHTPREGEWGDYLTVRRHQPQGKLFAATGYTVKGEARQDGDPRFVLFGRAADTNFTDRARVETMRSRTSLVISDAQKLPLRPGPVEAFPIVAVPLRPIQPGKERWPVKTGTDDDVADVGLDPSGQLVRIQTTVEQLIALARPREMLPADIDFPAFQRNRAHPVETTIWTVEAEIIACKEEDDGDYHIVIQGDTGETMIVEVPDPDPAFVEPSSPWVEAIKSSREEIQSRLNPERAMKKVRQRARIIGVGFFDRVHGQAGVASGSGIELHPALGVEWL